MRKLIALLFFCSLIMAACGDGSVPYIDDGTNQNQTAAADEEDTEDQTITLSPSAIEFMRDYQSPSEQVLELMKDCATQDRCTPAVASENLNNLRTSVINPVVINSMIMSN